MDIPPLPHRRNRRRERPGQRTRKALSLRGVQLQDFAEAQDIAHTLSIRLPGEIQPPCLCSSCFWERSGQTDEEMERSQSRYREEANDNELRSMGILYSIDEEVALESAFEKPIPQDYSIRYVRPKRSPRTQFQLPAYLAASLLSDNPAIARWILESTMIPTPATSDPNTPATQFWSRFPRSQPQSQSPQSLPPTLSNSVSPSTLSGTGNSRLALAQQQSPLQFPLPRLFPLNNDDEDLNESTWDFITNSTRPGSPALSLNSISTVPNNSTRMLPSSMPETWTMLSDDL